MNKEERVICEFEMDFKKPFCWRSNLSACNVNKKKRGLKKGVKSDIFLVWNRVRIWRTEWHTSTKNSQE